MRRPLLAPYTPPPDAQGAGAAEEAGRRRDKSRRESAGRVGCRERLRKFVQNTNAMAAACFLLWLVLGLLPMMCFGVGRKEQRFTWQESLYLMAQILTTVGYGDTPLPDRRRGYVFVTVYVLIAAMVIATFVSAAVNSILEQEEQLLTKMTRRLKTAINERAPSFDTHVLDYKMRMDSKSFLKYFAVWVIFLATWAAFFCLHPDERKEPTKAIYMAVISLTTIGFGDVTPSSDDGRLFAAVWMVLGSASFVIMVGKFTVWCLEEVTIKELDTASLERIFKDEHFQRCATERQNRIDEDWKQLLHKAKPHADMFLLMQALQHRHIAKQNRASRNDFIVFMLRDMGLMDADHIDKLNDHFDALDREKNGYLEENDVIEFIRRSS